MRFIFVVAVLFSMATMLEGSNDTIRVAIVGDGKLGTVDPQVLAQTFRQIKKQRPDFVFYTGNLISGLEQKTSIDSLNKFKSNLNRFSKIVEENLGTQIPLYPVMGNHTVVNTQAVEIFRNHFKLPKSAPLAPGQMAYTVTNDGAQFVILATGMYEQQYGRDFMPILDWLKKELNTGKRRFKNRFVIGHQPIFSPQPPSGIYRGSVKSTKEQDQFWSILKKTGVKAYFSSHSTIYDRSNRDGVWQVITGGSTSSGNDGEKKDDFSHFILLDVPKDRDGRAILRAVDINGGVWDSFELDPEDRPIHQFRISAR